MPAKAYGCFVISMKKKKKEKKSQRVGHPVLACGLIFKLTWILGVLFFFSLCHFVIVGLVLLPRRQLKYDVLCCSWFLYHVNAFIFSRDMFCLAAISQYQEVAIYLGNVNVLLHVMTLRLVNKNMCKKWHFYALNWIASNVKFWFTMFYAFVITRHLITKNGALFFFFFLMNRWNTFITIRANGKINGQKAHLRESQNKLVSVEMFLQSTFVLPYFWLCWASFESNMKSLHGNQRLPLLLYLTPINLFIAAFLFLGCHNSLQLKCTWKLLREWKQKQIRVITWRQKKKKKKKQCKR